MTKRDGGCRGRVAAGLVAAALLASGSAVPALAQSSAPVDIGWNSELSGSYSFFGNACTQGMKFAEQKINAAGGALGQPMHFLVTDNQTTPAQSAAAARAFDAQHHVLGLSGPTSSDDALAIYGYAEQHKLPFIVPVAAFPQLTKPGTRYTFRIEPDAVGWGYAFAKFFAERKPGARVAYLYNDIALAHAIGAGLHYQAPRSKINIVSDIVFPQGSNDATVQVAQVVAAKPDFVLLGTVGAFDITVTNQLLDLGIRPEQIVHDVGQTTTILAYGKRSVGSIYGTFFDANLDNVTPEGREFIAAFTKSVGRIPSYTENFCYITPYIFKAAAEKAGSTDREKFRNALSALKMTSPTDGTPIEFDKNGARKEYMYFMQITSMESHSYKAKKLYYTEWTPDVVPTYQLMK